MRKITTSIIASAILITGLQAFDLEYRLDTMEKKIHQLEKEKEVFSALKENYLSDIEDLEATLERLETDTALNSKMRWGLEFITNYNYFDITNTNGDAYQIDNFFRNKLNLNLFSTIGENMTFDGTISMYKNWSDNTPNAGSTYDSSLGARPNTEALSFTRAYINWKKEIIENIPMVLTFGRLPSSKGTSYDFQNNSVRQATFSALDFDGAADGFIITALTDKVSGLKNSSLRFAFGKGYQFDEASMHTPNMPLESAIEDTNVIGAFAEAAIPTYPDSMIQVGYVNAMDMIADPTNSEMSTMFGSPVTIPNTNVGDLELLSAAGFIKNVNQSNIDVFAHYTRSTATPSDTPFAGAVGLLSNGADTTKKEGSAYWIGARYNMDNGWKIGGEYNEGSKYWMSFTSGSESIYNKLATRGSATEAYLIVPINRYASFKFGYLNIDYKYTGSGMHLGEPVAIKDAPVGMDGKPLVDKMVSYYFNLEVRF